MNKTSLFFIMLLLCKLSFSELIVNVSNLTPTKNDVIALEVTFLDSDKENYTIEGIDKFEILSKGSSNSYKVVNGSTTSSKSDVYNLRAKSEGAISLTVVTSAGNSKSVELDVKTTEMMNEAVAEKFILKGNTSKTSYYFGEKIPYEEYFISGVRINSFSLAKSPNFKEFSFKDVTPYNNNTYIQNQIDFNGKQAVQLTLFKGILQANSSGDKSISTSTVKIGEPSKDFFNENVSFLGEETIDLEIKALPIDSPKNFKGIVGNLNFLENWKGKEVKVGEAISLTLTLHGSGNLALLENIPFEQNNDFNIFQSVKSYRENIIDGKYFNEKVFEIAFIPKKPGLDKTPKISIPYFNIETESYENFEIMPREIIVQGDEAVQNSNSDVLSPIQVNMENNVVNSSNNDFNLKSSNKIEEINIKVLEIVKKEPKNIYKLLFWILLSITSLITIIFFGLLLKRTKPKNNKKR
ncbi:MAG: BatD family protein [Cetobacterium sp.]